MSVRVRVAVALASILMVGTYFFPLWQISLKAPQYPEGLAIQIWLTKITGDIRPINVLNHYIGMAKIEPDHIPELSYFKYIMGALAAFGLLACLVNRKRLIQLWCFAVIGSALLGLYDFYRWEYNYGHNLSPDAPMQIEESYQPPLLGEKQLANITAISWPKEGGYAFSGAAVLATLVLLLSFRAHGTRETMASIFLVVFLPLLAHCNDGQGPQAIEIGRDACDFCRMVIVDGRFGGEIVTQKGKVYKFDSLKCLVGFYGGVAAEKTAVYVQDFLKPGTLLPAESAVFTMVKEHIGPMESNEVAFASAGEAQHVLVNENPTLIGWEELRKTITL